MNWKKFEADTMPDRGEDIVVGFIDSKIVIACFLSDEDKIVYGPYMQKIKPSMRWIYLDEIPKPTE